MSCCQCIDTPQSIKDADNVDVFEQIIPATAYEYLKKREELWARYRYHGLGSCNRSYWIQCMKDRYALIEDTWDVKIRAWKQYAASVSTTVDFSQSSAETKTVYEHEDCPDSPAGTTIYLADRNTTTYEGKNYDGLESKTVDDYIKYVPDPWDGFTSQFRELFYFGV